MSMNNTNPGTLFGGTWTQLKDKFLLGVGDTYKTVNITGGNSTITLSTSTTNTNTGSSESGNTGSTGNGTAVNIMPPYLTVYMWQRTA